MSAPVVSYDAQWQRSVRSITRAYSVAAALSAALAAMLHQRGCHPVAVAFAADVFATAVIFAFSLEHNNTSIYDPYWHLAPPAVVGYWIYARASLGAMPRSAWVRCAAISLTMLCWSLRLTWNWLRGWGGLAHEDWRYVKLKLQMRARGWPEWAYWFGLSLLGYHLMPTLVVFLAMLPTAVAVAGCGTTAALGGALDALALVVGLGGVAIQAVADEQLRAYRRARALAPRAPQFESGVARVGLWRYSRHPNYLGELMHHFAYVLFALGAGAGRAHVLALAGWVPLLALFTCASIPLMEAQQLKAKPAFADYQRQVPALLPLPWRSARCGGRKD